MPERRNSKSFRDRKVPNSGIKAKKQIQTNTNSFPIRPQMFVIRTKRISSLADREKALKHWNLQKNDVCEQIQQCRKLKKGIKMKEDQTEQKDREKNYEKYELRQMATHQLVSNQSVEQQQNKNNFVCIEKQSILEAYLLSIDKNTKTEVKKKQQQLVEKKKTLQNSLDKKIQKTRNLQTQKMGNQWLKNPINSDNIIKKESYMQNKLQIMSKDAIMLQLNKKLSVKGLMKKKKRIATQNQRILKQNNGQQRINDRENLQKQDENMSVISESVGKNKNQIFQNSNEQMGLCQSIIINDSFVGQYPNNFIAPSKFESFNKLQSNRIEQKCNKENEKKREEIGQGTRRSVSIKGKSSRGKKINECKLRRINWGGNSHTNKNIFDPKLSSIQPSQSNKLEQPLESLKELFEQMKE